MDFIQEEEEEGEVSQPHYKSFDHTAKPPFWQCKGNGESENWNGIKILKIKDLHDKLKGMVFLIKEFINTQS